MEVFEAIHGRYMTSKVKPDPVPRGLIEKLLDAAVQAPSHYRVTPWRFVVLTGEARNKLGDVMATSQRDRFPDLPPEGADRTRALPLRAPVVIAVGVDKPSEQKVSEIENICASAAACQNILLAARSLGLGAQWRTGEWALDANVKKHLGFVEDQHLIAFMYVGYPEVTPEPYQRHGFEDRTVWME